MELSGGVRDPQTEGGAMEGYEVVTVDDDKVGKVVGTEGPYLIVEGGTLFKSRHAVPRDLASVDDEARTVRVTIAKEMIGDSPKVNGELDRRAVGEYYGLGEGFPAPETEGYGTLGADETATSAEVEGADDGVTPPVQQRAETRESLRPEGEDFAREGVPGAQIRPTSGTD
jgi:hypothetical protein